jgi:integrase
LNYLSKRDNVYYFRLRVPKDLHRFFPVREIKKSLKTQNLNCAKMSAKALSFKAEKLFTIIRSDMLTDEQIKRLVAEQLRSGLKDAEEYRARKSYPDAEVAWEEIETFEMLHYDAMRDLVANNLKAAEHPVSLLLEEHGITLEKSSDAYKKLCREVLKTNVEFLRIEIERMKGNYKNEYDSVYNPVLTQPGTVTFAATAHRAESRGKLLSEAIEEYTAFKKGAGNWTTKTQDGFIGFFRLLRDAVRVVTGKEDTEIKAIDFPTMQKVRDILKKLPPGFNKKKAYKNRPLETVLHIIEGLPVEPIAPKTFNTKIDVISAMFEYASQRDYIDKNPAKGLRLPENANNKSWADIEAKKKIPYTHADLKSLFSSPLFTSPAKKAPEKFWIPLIALYTGARREEICQLRVADIIGDSGIPCFNITDREEDQKVKTKAAIRKVPIHPQLTALGLLQYVENLRVKGKVRLWENLKADKYGSYGKRYGANFLKYLRRKHIIEDKRKDFHSFRRTFINALKQNGENVHLMQEIVGHEEGDTPLVIGTYSNDFSVPIRFEAIKKLDFDLDLSHLKDRAPLSG